MRILGMDVSSKSTGWAVLDNSSGDQIVDYGLIDTSAFGDIPERMLHFEEDLWGLVSGLKNEGEIDWVAIEDVPLVNVRTLKILSEFIGITKLHCTSAFYLHKQFSSRDLDDLLTKVLTPRRRKNIEVPARGILMLTASEASATTGMGQLMKDRKLKKEAAIDWCRDFARVTLTADQDDIADAIVLAYAANVKLNRFYSIIRSKQET